MHIHSGSRVGATMTPEGQANLKGQAGLGCKRNGLLLGGQSLLQRAPVVASSVEKFECAQGQITVGQRCRVIAREVFQALLQVAQRLFTDGRSCEQVLEVLMPA
jgi:hypothetical protein